jgi:hypothetical protein
MQRIKSQWSDLLCITVILLITLIVFGLESSRLGFYADDASFLTNAPNLKWSTLIDNMLGYVTGRNLHMLWQFGIYQILGYGLSDLALHHWLQALVSGINAGVLYIAIRVFGYKTLPAFLAAIIFAFYPNHAEVQYWLSSLPMNLISTFFVLIQIILSVICLKDLANQKADFIYKVLFFSFIAYVCALFTYDQVVPIVVTLSTILGLSIFFNKQFRWAGAIYLLVSLGIFLALLAWKIRVPAGGPIFNNINVAHIWYTFNLSLAMMFGFHLQNGLQNLIIHADLNQKIFAFSCVLVIFSTSLLLIWEQFTTIVFKQKNLKNALFSARSSWYLHPLVLQLIKFLFPIAFYLLAYLPVYIWYIAPRHNYLPSIAVAFGIAFIFSALLWISQLVLRRWGPLAMGIALSVISALFIYKCIKGDLVEKQAWISSYQARKNLYSELGDAGHLKNGMALIIGNIPTVTPYGSAPLGYQPSFDVELITEGRIKIKYLDRNIQPSESGVYLLSSANDYGLDAFQHVLWSDAVVLQYKGFNGQKIQYDIVRPQDVSPNYSLINSRPLSKLQPEKFSAYLDKGILKIEMPNISLGRGETVTLLPFIKVGDKKSPLTTINPVNIPLSFLIEVPPRLIGRGFDISLPFKMPKISDVQIYISNGDQGNRFLAEVPVLSAPPTLVDGINLSK